MADPSDTDPNERDPRDEGLRRRSGNASVSPWLIVASLLLLGVVVYIAMSLFSG